MFLPIQINTAIATNGNTRTKKTSGCFVVYMQKAIFLTSIHHPNKKLIKLFKNNVY